MRDVFFSAIIFGLIPFILRRPFVGLLTWVWVGMMNPHRLSWGWAYDFPFSMMIALCLFASMLLNADKLRKPVVGPFFLVLIAFSAWMCVSPLFSYHPELEYWPWSRAVKIQLMVVIAMFIVHYRDQIDKLVLVMAASVGFFGVKGGIFTVLNGGENRVWGPDGSFIEDNNALALAVIMVIPLFRYVQLHVAKKPWQKYACMGAMLLCVLSALGSYSRGALLALLAMSTVFLMKSRNKLVIIMLGLMAVLIAVPMMPDEWFQRMNTIQDYQSDGSAMGRINAWWMAWNLAKDRFPIGGGFASNEADVFARYAPDPMNVRAAHSIYFQVLGEHGFMGLFIYVMIFVLAWRAGSWTIKHTKQRPEYAWARDMASMLQVSLLGFAVGGAFLSLTYFDLPYYIAICLVMTRDVVKTALDKAAERAPLSPMIGGRGPRPVGGGSISYRTARDDGSQTGGPGHDREPGAPTRRG